MLVFFFFFALHHAVTIDTTAHRHLLLIQIEMDRGEAGAFASSANFGFEPEARSGTCLNPSFDPACSA